MKKKKKEGVTIHVLVFVSLGDNIADSLSHYEVLNTHTMWLLVIAVVATLFEFEFVFLSSFSFCLSMIL